MDGRRARDENLELHCTKRYIVIFAFPRNGAWAFNAECQTSFYETHGNSDFRHFKAPRVLTTPARFSAYANQRCNTLLVS